MTFILIFFYLDTAHIEKENSIQANTNFKSTTYQLLIHIFPENRQLVCSQYIPSSRRGWNPIFFNLSLVACFIQHEYSKKRFSIEGASEDSLRLIMNNCDLKVTSQWIFLRDENPAVQTTPRNT